MTRFRWWLLAAEAAALVLIMTTDWSGSAAVAAAIREFNSRRGIEIFADDRYFPNKVVFRKVLRALKNNK